ncbi:MAG TPA: glycosyltransferase [Candidatus Limnocylindria bacterium]|nr:glycosyltransferase [Candidatus Limnocylindria bacterium]
MVATPSFSIVIPTYDRADVVERTLRHLAALDYPADLYEVLVVDNSSDGTPAMVERVAREARCEIRLLRRPDRLPAVKRNIGLREARGEHVLFLNDDVWSEPQLLREHAASHAASRPEPAAVVGLVVQSSEMPATPFLDAYRPFAYWEIQDRADREVGYQHFWSMDLSLPRRVMLERNLLFHEDWREIGHEDIELGYRWTRAGLRVIYNPRARVHHFHPHTLDSACRLQESIGRGLRDLESLIPEPDLLERYGVLSLRSSPRALVRGLVRTALFNRWTVPAVRRWLGPTGRAGALPSWLYWKVMLYHTNRGYRSAAPRRVPALETRPAGAIR